MKNQEEESEDYLLEDESDGELLEQDQNSFRGQVFRKVLKYESE